MKDNRDGSLTIRIRKKYSKLAINSSLPAASSCQRIGHVMFIISIRTHVVRSHRSHSGLFLLLSLIL